MADGVPFGSGCNRAGAPVELRILGPTEVRHDGSPVTLRGAKPRQLLVLLAMRPNRPVPAEELIEELWDGEPPPSAATALRVHVGRLRQVLELDAQPERAERPAARRPARLPPAGRARRARRAALRTAARAGARGRRATAIRGAAVPRLTEALDLWRGAALADARDLSATRSEIARLEELRVVAIEELADVRLALGEHALVIDSLDGGDQGAPAARAADREPHARAVPQRAPGRCAPRVRRSRAPARRGARARAVGPAAPAGRRRVVAAVDARLRRAPHAAAHVGATRAGRASASSADATSCVELVELYDEAGRRAAPRRARRRPARASARRRWSRSTARESAHEGAAPLVGYCDPNPAGDYQPVAEILRALVAATRRRRAARAPVGAAPRPARARRPARPSRRPIARAQRARVHISSCSTRSRRRSNGWPSRRSCSSSRTSTGPTARRSCSSGTCCAIRASSISCWSRRCATTSRWASGPSSSSTSRRGQHHHAAARRFRRPRGARADPLRRRCPRRCPRSSTRRARCATSPAATRSTCASCSASSTRNRRATVATTISRTRSQRSPHRACARWSTAVSTG